jgi:hypothetical protein
MGKTAKNILVIHVIKMRLMYRLHVHGAGRGTETALGGVITATRCRCRSQVSKSQQRGGAATRRCSSFPPAVR